MQIYDSSQIKIGYYSSQCCHLDLFKIETDSELELVKTALDKYDNDDGGWVGVWTNKFHALWDLHPLCLEIRMIKHRLFS